MYIKTCNKSQYVITIKSWTLNMALSKYFPSWSIQLFVCTTFVSNLIARAEVGILLEIFWNCQLQARTTIFDRFQVFLSYQIGNKKLCKQTADTSAFSRKEPASNFLFFQDFSFQCVVILNHNTVGQKIKNSTDHKTREIN